MRRFLLVLASLATAVLASAQTDSGAGRTPLTQAAVVAALSADLASHFNLEGDLQLELLRPWNPPALVASDWRVVINEYPSLAGPAMLLRCTLLADGAPAGDVTLTRFSNPAGLRSLGGNMYEETAASGTPEGGNPGENGFARTIQGYIEASNVNIVEEMVNLIVAQRAYEVNSKSIQASDEMLQNVANLKR